MIIEFETINGIPKEDGYLSNGYPYKVIANCECGYKWTLRGIRQINELIIE